MGTRFASGQLCIKDDNGQGHLSQNEQLAEACWNGLLQEMMPELFDKIINTENFLWQIREGKRFLELEWSQLPGKKDGYYSIDPYDFLEAENFN